MAADDQHGLKCACGTIFETADALADHVEKQKWQPDPDQATTREPTDEELEDLTEWCKKTYVRSREEAVDIINQSYVTVIENYTTGCPGYAGRLLIQIGYGDPGMHHIFRWHNGNLIECEQAEELRTVTG